MTRYIVFLFLALLSFSAFSQNNDEIAVRARKAYESGQFKVSTELYEQILKNGYESAVLYYNLGNAYFRDNDLPSAILNYEKAKKLDPTHVDIQYNITIANSRITDKVEPIPELFYKRWWKSFLNIMNTDQFAIALILLLLICFIAAAFYLTSRVLMVRKVAFWGGLSILMIFFITLYATQQKYHYLKNHHEAIVFSPTVTVKSSPDISSKDLFVIHEGLKVELLDKIGEWQEIRIANGSVGWLKTSDLKLI